MTYKLKLNKTIAPSKSSLELAFPSPIGWWKVTTEGDCEGRSTRQLGTHYGHIAEIAFSIEEGFSYSYRFEKGAEPSGVYGSPEDHHKKRQAVRAKANISIDTFNYKGGEKTLAKWLDCSGDVVVKPCTFYGAYTLEMLP